MKKVIAGLDKRDYVERYAWFSFKSNGLQKRTVQVCLIIMKAKSLI